MVTRTSLNDQPSREIQIECRYLVTRKSTTAAVSPISQTTTFLSVYSSLSLPISPSPSFFILSALPPNNDDIYQGMYNALTRGAESELLPALRRYGLAFYAYNPLAAGIFSGKYTSVDDRPAEGRFSDVDSERGTRYRERYFRPAVFEALAVIEPVATREGLTLVEVAIRWLVHHSGLKVADGGPDGVVLGVSSLAQLEQNLDAMEAGPLPEAVVQALDAAWKTVKPESSDYWIGKLEYGYDTRRALFNI